MKLPAIVAALLTVAALIFASCGSESSTQAAETKAAPVVSSNPLEIQVRPDLLLQVKVGEPKWQNVSDSMSVPGRIEADETRSHADGLEKVSARCNTLNCLVVVWVPILHFGHSRVSF